MRSDFLIIAITPESIFNDEANAIVSILENGKAYYLHIRHPKASPEDVKHLIEEIPLHLRDRLTLHDHFSIVDSMVVGGIHLNSRNPLLPSGYKGRISRSCHSIEEIQALPVDIRYDYVTLSPIFDSISKAGYRSKFSLESLSDILADLHQKVVALGGVTPDRLDAIRKAGFCGAAMLGHFFPSH